MGLTPLFDFDQQIRDEGFRVIAGVDEAGRGTWAGPVVAAIVVFPPHINIPGANDSKKLSPRERACLFTAITSSCLDFAVGVVDHSVIDHSNILQATLLAMRHAVLGLTTHVDVVLVDGNQAIPSLSHAQRCITGGDGLSLSIAAASIIAKVSRDRLMLSYDARYPGWGFAKHKGYGTAAHSVALEARGLSPIHRRSFAPMKDLYD